MVSKKQNEDLGLGGIFSRSQSALRAPGRRSSAPRRQWSSPTSGAEPRAGSGAGCEAE